MLSILVIVSSLISFFASLLQTIRDAMPVRLSRSWWKYRGTEAVSPNVLPIHRLETVPAALPTIPPRAYVGGSRQGQRPGVAVNQSTRPGSPAASVYTVSTRTIPTTAVTVYPFRDNAPHYNYKATAADVVHPRAARSPSIFPTRSRVVNLGGPYPPSVATAPIIADDDAVASLDKRPINGLAVIREEDWHTRDVEVQMIATPECSSGCIDVQSSQDDRACAQKSGTPRWLSSLDRTQANVRAEVSEVSEHDIQLSPCPPLSILKDDVALSLAILRSADLSQFDPYAFDQCSSSSTVFSTCHDDIIHGLPLNDAMLFAPFMTLRHESSPNRSLDRAAHAPHTTNASDANRAASAAVFFNEISSSSTPPEDVHSVTLPGHPDVPPIHAICDVKVETPVPTALPTSLSDPSEPAIQTSIDSGAQCLAGLDISCPATPFSHDSGGSPAPPHNVGRKAVDGVSQSVVSVGSESIVNAWWAVALPANGLNTAEDAVESPAGSLQLQSSPSFEPVSFGGSPGDGRRILCAANDDAWFVGNTKKRIANRFQDVGDRSHIAFPPGITGLVESTPLRSGNTAQSPDVSLHHRPIFPSRLRIASSLLYNPSGSSPASSPNLPNHVDATTPSAPPLPIITPLTPAAPTPVAATQARSTLTVTFNDGKEPMDCQVRVDAHRLMPRVLPKESVHRSIKCELLGKG
ncbi:hypothetical protein FRB96_003697, partial [Tulasnella sp. 330]